MVLLSKSGRFLFGCEDKDYLLQSRDTMTQQPNQSSGDLAVHSLSTDWGDIQNQVPKKDFLASKSY